MIVENPLKGISTQRTKRPDRMAFVDRTTIQKVLDACPTSRWKAILVATDHYLQVRDVDFDKAAQKPVQQQSATPATGRSACVVTPARNQEPPGFPGVATQCQSLQLVIAPRLGDESSREAKAETAISVASGAESGAVGARETLVDPGLERLAELWPMLSPDDQAALLAHAEHLASLTDKADHLL
jgi:hypothetical protein